ncbi:MAG TPA: hypothetical protein VH092_01415 [Urbifossiella sp.]|jgi:hypothetical protein|nr:hypothetical protein [Urbifossiella sp.]
MDEHEWSTSSNWLGLWHAVKWGEEMDRKRRLIANGACRRLLHLITDPRLIRFIELSDARADGEIEGESWDKWDEAEDEARDAANEISQSVTAAAAGVVAGLRNDDHKIGRTLEMVGDVFGYQSAIAARILPHDATCEDARRVWTDPVFVAGRDEDGGRFLADVIREVMWNPFRPLVFEPCWRTEAAVSLARGMYESRDFTLTTVLADAIEDAGCADADALAHCRGPGPHVRGCWVVDLVLGKV